MNRDEAFQNEIFDYSDKKNSCDGCKYDEEDDAYPSICWECSRYYSDRFEKKEK